MAYKHLRYYTFTYSLVIDEATAQTISHFLISNEGMDGGLGPGWGSSFAITARESVGQRKLWLSDSSYRRLLADERYADQIRQADSEAEPSHPAINEHSESPSVT